MSQPSPRPAEGVTDADLDYLREATTGDPSLLSEAEAHGVNAIRSLLSEVERLRAEAKDRTEYIRRLENADAHQMWMDREAWKRTADDRGMELQRLRAERDKYLNMLSTFRDHAELAGDVLLAHDVLEIDRVLAALSASAPEKPK